MSTRSLTLKWNTVETNVEWREGNLTHVQLSLCLTQARANGVWTVTHVTPDGWTSTKPHSTPTAACTALGRALPAGASVRLTTRRTILSVPERLDSVCDVTLIQIAHSGIQDYQLTLGWGRGVEGLSGRLSALARMVTQELDALAQAAPAPQGRYLVALDGEAAGMLIIMGVGYLLEGDRILAGTSRLADCALGDRIAPQSLTINDDPTQPIAALRFACDDEGTPTQPVTLLADGCLTGYVTDRLSAQHLGVAANGHARTDLHTALPSARIGSLHVAPGVDTRGSVLRQAEGGLYGQGVRNAAVDVATGMVHLTVRCGWRILNGIPSQPIAPFSLGLRFPEAWSQLLALGREPVSFVRPLGKGRPLQTVPIGCQAPTLALRDAYVG